MLFRSVVVATVIAERANFFIAAMVAALPISAGPGYLFIALEHGSVAVAKSAVVGAGVNAAMAIFLYIAVITIPRAGIAVGLVAALAAWSTAAFVVLQISLGLFGAFVLNCVAYVLFPRLIWSRITFGAPKAPRLRALDVAIRALAVAGVAFTVLQVSNTAGPEVAGLVALTPVVWISVSVVVFVRLGGDACAAVLANGMLAMFGYCLAFVALHLLAMSHGSVAGLSVALLICVGWNIGLTLCRPYIGSRSG